MNYRYCVEDKHYSPFLCSRNNYNQLTISLVKRVSNQFDQPSKFTEVTVIQQLVNVTK